MKRLNLVGLFLSIFAVSILAGCAATSSSVGQDTSWWGKSGAKTAPIKDAYTTKDTSNPTATAVKKGSWWMPEQAPRGKSGTVWGNRGYVYLAGEGEKAAPKPAVKRAALQDVYFPYDSVELTSASKKILNDNIAILKKSSNPKVVLMGYASPEGADDYNMNLSRRRALAVKDYLVKNGVSVESVSVTAEGEMAVDKSAYPSARKVHIKSIYR